MAKIWDIDRYQLEIRDLEKQMDIKFECQNNMIEAEAKRLDSIRVVDSNAVALANKKAIAQVEVLASQVIASSESLKTLISSTNNAITQQLSQISTQLADRISVLEKIQYESEGRSKLSSSLLMTISGFTGGIIVFVVQKLLGL